MEQVELIERVLKLEARVASLEAALSQERSERLSYDVLIHKGLGRLANHFGAFLDLFEKLVKGPSVGNSGISSRPN